MACAARIDPSGNRRSISRPEGVKERRNAPANTSVIARSLAELLGRSIEQVAEQTTANAQFGFRLTSVACSGGFDDATKPRILIATNNAGKLAEFERLLGRDYQVDGLAGLDVSNCRQKERHPIRTMPLQRPVFVAAATGRLTLGDDSGIEAEALDGDHPVSFLLAMPVSRFRIDATSTSCFPRSKLEEGSTARRVLSAGSPWPMRMVLIASVEGTCEGTIGFEPVGSNGFGYDPIFVFPSGERWPSCPIEEKDAISHRGKAMRAMIRFSHMRSVRRRDDA